MAPEPSRTQKLELTPEVRHAIDAWVHKFPEGKQRSAVLMALRVVQDDQGWLSDAAMDAVAAYLNLPSVWVYEVATFYSLYHRRPVGRHVLRVCNSISCYLCGAHDLIAHLEKVLNVRLGGTTQDGAITLLEAECLAACCGAPALVLDDKLYYENLTPEAVDALLVELYASAGMTLPESLQGRGGQA